MVPGWIISCKLNKKITQIENPGIYFNHPKTLPEKDNKLGKSFDIVWRQKEHTEARNFNADVDILLAIETDNYDLVETAILRHFADAKMLVSCVAGTKNVTKKEIIRSTEDYPTDAVINTIIRIVQELPSASAVSIDGLSKHITELKNDIDNLSNSIKMKDEIIESLKESKNEMKEIVKTLKDSNDAQNDIAKTLKDSNDKLIACNDKLNEKLTKTKNELTKTKNELNKVKNELNKVKNELNKVKNDLNEANERTIIMEYMALNTAIKKGKNITVNELYKKFINSTLNDDDDDDTIDLIPKSVLVNIIEKSFTVKTTKVNGKNVKVITNRCLV